MAEMKYPTVTVTHDGERSRYDYDTAPEHLTEGTYALVPVPDGERMVVVVTEGGRWPTEVIRAMAGGFILGPGETAGENARDMLDAVVSLAEGET